MRRGVRPLVVVLVVLVVLVALVSAFFWADSLVRRRVEDDIQQRLRRSPRISDQIRVSIRQTPVIPQVLADRLDVVEISDGEVDGRLRLRGVRATLRGVTRERGGAAVRVQDLAGSGFVSYSEFQRASGREDVRVSQAGGDQVRLSGAFKVFGRAVPVTVRSRIAVLPGNRFQVRASDVKVDLKELPVLRGLISDLLRDRLDFDVPVTELPPGLQMTGVRVGPDGVQVDLHGRNVLFTAP